MSMADRGWYRDDARQRHARAHDTADAQWSERENRPRRPIDLHLPRNRLRLRSASKPIALTTVFCLLAVMVGRSGFLGAAQHALLPSTSPASGVPAPPFPVNGYTLLHYPAGSQATAPLTLQTAPDLGRRWVAALRDWSSDALVATVYLEGNSIATINLPGGRYRLVEAEGENWAGDDAMFGAATEYHQALDPVVLTVYPDHFVGRVVYMMRAANPNMRMGSAGVGDFRAR